MRQQDDDSSLPSATPKRPAKRPTAPRAKRKDLPKHRGVRLLDPAAAGGRHRRWRVRYRDPDTKLLRTEPVPDHVGESKEGLAHYAAKLLRQLQRRSEDIAAGATPHAQAGLPLTDAVDRYFRDNARALRPRTLRTYREQCDAFLAWAAENRLQTVRQLTRGKLKEYAAHVSKQPLAGGGERAPHTVKKALRSVATVLNWLYEAEVSRLGFDDVRMGLKSPRMPKPGKRAFLSHEQIAKLLELARAHDDIRFKATRDMPYLPKGATHPTARYAPIEPVIRFLLLSGMRLGELATLRVGDVHLAHGYLDVQSVNTKTKTGRTVRFDVAPSMATILEPRVRGRDASELVFSEHIRARSKPGCQDLRGGLNAALRRLQAEAPTFSYQLLRVTCATYLANMRDVGPVNESIQLGHSIQIAQDFYIGRMRIAPECKTLEQAMGLSA